MTTFNANHANGLTMMGFTSLGMIGGKLTDEQSKYFKKGRAVGYYLGRFGVRDDDSQSRVQAIGQELNILNYRKKPKNQLVEEIKYKQKMELKKRNNLKKRVGKTGGRTK